MALTLDGVMPALDHGDSGMGIGGGVLGGALAGALTGGLFGRGMGGWGGYGGYGYGAPGGPAANAVASSVVLDPAFQSLQTQLTGIQSQLSTGGIHGEINELEKSLESANLANLQGIASNALTYQTGNSNLMTAQATGNFTTLNSINGLGRDIVASNTQALINNLQNFNSLSAQISTAGNQIIAGQNTQNATMAQCCCDLRQAIAADGQATRALINDNTIQSLRDRNADLAVRVSNNEQNQYLLTTILQHFHPTTQVVA